MADSETQKELEELRRQVATLAETRAHSETAPPEVTESASARSVAEESPEEAGIAQSPSLAEQIEELVDVLGDEFRDNPALAGVAIFAAGLLVGRLLR